MSTAPWRVMPGRDAYGRITQPVSHRTTTWPIGEQMREARFNAELTQKAVARRMFVSPRTVREWESGRRKPTVEMLDAYLKIVKGSITLGVPR